MLIINSKKSMIVFLYPFYLFENVLIILLSFNGFNYNNSFITIKANIMVNLLYIWIKVIFDRFLDSIV